MKGTETLESDISIYIPFNEQFKACAEAFLSRNLEDVYIESYDGLKLHAYFYQAEKPRGTVVLVHGYKGYGLRDFSLVFDFYISRSFNILLIDQRSHGKSEGKYICFGVKERYDVKSWVEFLNKKIDDSLPILLDGVSMGCSTVLYASVLGLPENVKGIIADCGFTSPWDILSKVSKQRYNLPKWPLMHIARIIIKLVCGFDIKACSTLEVLKENKIPVFFATGESDCLVPDEMTKKNFLVCTARKNLFLVPDADHALAYCLAKEKYEKELLKFYDFL